MGNHALICNSLQQVDGDGDYLLVLKMSEVYFNAPNMKVFDVVLNGDLTVSSDLDIFEKVKLSETAFKPHLHKPIRAVNAEFAKVTHF